MVQIRLYKATCGHVIPRQGLGDAEPLVIVDIVQ